MKKSKDTETKNSYIAPFSYEVGYDCEGILCSSDGTASWILDMDYEDISDWN